MKTYPVKLANKLHYQVELVTYQSRGQVICQEDTEAKYVIFIKEGEFEIVKESFEDG